MMWFNIIKVSPDERAKNWLIEQVERLDYARIEDNILILIPRWLPLITSEMPGFDLSDHELISEELNRFGYDISEVYHDHDISVVEIRYDLNNSDWCWEYVYSGEIIVYTGNGEYLAEIPIADFVPACLSLSDADVPIYDSILTAVLSAQHLNSWDNMWDN